jgi:hypothetical protein
LFTGAGWGTFFKSPARMSLKDDAKHQEKFYLKGNPEIKVGESV